MSSLDNIYQKMVPTLDPATLTQLHPQPPPPEPSNQIGREVAHELNNILTIIQGYADRILLKQEADAAWRPELQVISDNARRAVAVVRQASPRKPALAKVLA
jgi:nitrogen-specific signal transduction histidine kinase